MVYRALDRKASDACLRASPFFHAHILLPVRQQRVDLLGLVQTPLFSWAKPTFASIKCGKCFLGAVDHLERLRYSCDVGVTLIQTSLFL